MTALLLARLVGVPVRRAHAGSQEGKDALSDDGGFAIECKRYGKNTRLGARFLISELEEVRPRHPSLQLWVLVTTTAVDPTIKEKVDRAAHDRGLAVLYLDTASTGPYLTSVDALTALCATDVETTLEFLSGLGSDVCRDVREELETIRSDPNFETWAHWLAEEIRTRLPVWRFIVERQNLALAKQIRETAYTAFGTDYDAVQTVPRKVRARLDEWFREALKVESPETPPIAVVLGERYDGKTWLVYQWLLEIAESSEVPLFFVGSGRGLQSDRRLTRIQSEDLVQAFHKGRAHADDYVHHFRDRSVAKTPWALVVLDGINEYAPNHAAWRRHLEAALGRGESNCRPAAVLLTVRERAWPELKELLPGIEPVRLDSHQAGRAPDPGKLDLREIHLGPFDEEELQGALKRLNLPADFLETLPPNARSLAKRPRYLRLLAEHRSRLGDYAAVTAEVLHWLDLCDKVGRSREGMEDWGPEQYQGVLRGFAGLWLAEKFLDEAGVRGVLKDVTTDVHSVLAELRSEGVLSGEAGNYTVEPSRLTMGYGLFLRDVLIRASRQKKDLNEALNSSLAPLVEGDEAVAALRAAATLMLVEVASKSAPSPESIEILDLLLRTWLESRNLGLQDLEAIDSLKRLLFTPLLRSWRETWQKERRNSRMREVALMVFGEAVQADSSERDCLRKAIQEWFRLVPLEGSWFLKARFQTELKAENDDDEAVVTAIAAHIQRQIAVPSFGRVGLQLSEKLDVLSLQSLGLHLASRVPDLVSPEDLLALMVVRVILHEQIDSGAFWVIRCALEDTPAQWFEQTSLRYTKESKDILSRALDELIRISDRSELKEIKERLRGPGKDEEESTSPDERPTRRTYQAMLRRALGSPLKLRRFAEQMRELLCDPALPLPAKAQRLAFAQTLRKLLTEESDAGRYESPRDLDALCPAMAAWAPTLGTDVIEKIIEHLPEDVRRGDRNLGLELRGHAALAAGGARRALRQALRLARRRQGVRWSISQREIELALLPAAKPAETLALLGNEKEKWQHKETLQLSGFLCTTADRRALVEALGATVSPARKRRLRFLLAAAGGFPLLSVREIHAISRTLRAGRGFDVTAALDLAVRQKNEITDPVLLLPIASASNGKLRGHNYASSLLVKWHPHEEIKDHLDDYWCAVSAARRAEDARPFLDEISADLRRYEADRASLSHRWQRYDLPSEIIRHLDAERVAAWTRAFKAWDGSGSEWWGGLIRPTFDWCLRHAAEEARALWPDVYPFQRRRFGGGTRAEIEGVDWVLHALNRPQSDDTMSRELLSDLILDARTDLELFEIALGAHFQGAHRVHDIAQGLSSDSQAERRARGVAILGWLGEGKDRLESLQKQDPSLWVRGQAELALSRHALESWARSWFEKFLSARSVAARWAAGRLFLECADLRLNTWAWKKLYEGRFGRRLKGEAVLLLWAAQEGAKTRSDKLKETLLGYRVYDLATVAHPWRRDDEWILSRYGRRD